MKIRQLSDDEIARLNANYGDLIELLSRSELDTQSLLGILFKAAMKIAVSAEYDRDEVLGVVAATYDMERFLRPSSEEVH